MDELNRNALFVKWGEQHLDCAAFEHEGGERYKSRSPKVIGMWRYLNEFLTKNGEEPIDFLEFGVWGGQSLRSWASLSTHADSRFFGFDSFEGLPEDWRSARGRMSKGTFSTDGKPPEIDDDRVRYVKGLYQDTLSAFLEDYQPQRNKVIHVDCDLYSSTLYVLTQLDPILEDSIVIFDEFDKILHEFRAFQDYVQSYRRTYRVMARVDYFRKVGVRINGIHG